VHVLIPSNNNEGKTFAKVLAGYFQNRQEINPSVANTIPLMEHTGGQFIAKAEGAHDVRLLNHKRATVSLPLRYGLDKTRKRFVNRGYLLLQLMGMYSGLVPEELMLIDSSNHSGNESEYGFGSRATR